MADTKPDIKPALPQQPDEDEILQMSIPAGGGTIWSVKIPRFLHDKWMQVDQEGVHLGTLVVDDSVKPARITLKIPTFDEPTSSGSSGSSGSHSTQANSSTSANGQSVSAVKPEPGPSSTRRWNTQGLPPTYSLQVPLDRARNTWVFSETKRDTRGLRLDGGEVRGKRKREKANPALLGPVAHECTLHPASHSVEYTRIVSRRLLEAENGRRQMQRLEDVLAAEGKGQGRANMMASGWGNVASSLGRSMVDSSSKLPPGDKYVRLPRNELRNRLFNAYLSKPYWSPAGLRAELKQPDGYLREVLREVAVEIRDGAYRGLWELKPEWRGAGAAGVSDKAGTGRGAGAGPGEGEGGAGDAEMRDVKPQVGEEDDWDEDDEDEDEFEEVG